MKFEWTDEFCSGNSIIDFQHRLLFKFVNKLKSKIKSGDSIEAAEEMIQFFKVYFIEHFGDEEKIMKETQYPKILVHLREHRRIRHEAETILRILKKSRYSSEKVYESFLEASRWLKKHFAEMDRELIAFLKEYNTEYDQSKNNTLN